MEVSLPYFDGTLPGHYTRSRILLRGLSPTQIETARRIRDGAIAETATLENGRPVQTDEDAVQYALELVAAAAED